MDFPIKNGDFPWQNVSLPEGMSFHMVFCRAPRAYVRRGGGPRHQDMNYWLQRIPVNQHGHLASGDDPGDVRDVRDE